MKMHFKLIQIHSFKGIPVVHFHYLVIKRG